MKIIFYGIMSGLLMVFGLEAIEKKQPKKEKNSTITKTIPNVVDKLTNRTLTRKLDVAQEEQNDEEPEGYTISARSIWNGFTRLLGWAPVALVSKKAVSSRYGQEFIADLYSTANKKVGITKAFNNVIYNKFYNDDLKNAANALEEKLKQLNDKIEEFEDGTGEDSGDIDERLRLQVQAMGYMLKNIKLAIKRYDDIYTILASTSRKDASNVLEKLKYKNNFQGIEAYKEYIDSGKKDLLLKPIKPITNK